MKTYTLQDVKPLGQIIEELKPRLPHLNSIELENAFERFWNAGEEPSYIYYSKDLAYETIEQMKAEFLEDMLGGEVETLAGTVARLTGLELVGESSTKKIRIHDWRYS